MLAFLGYDVEDTSEFDAKTKAALEKYQTENHLAVTGTADKETVQNIEAKTAQKVAKEDNAYQKAKEQLEK